MKKHILLPILVGIAVFAITFFSVSATAVFATTLSSVTEAALDNRLKVVIIRHGEKPEPGDNLSCQGENRALQLPAVLYQKFSKPDYTYVPQLESGKSTAHARMFQTVTPFAIKYDLRVNSEFGKNDYSKIANQVLKQTGTVLMVWEHKAIRPLAEKLGVNNLTDWEDTDFDSIWVITFKDGKASLSIDNEGITPSPSCNF
jgi:hypothetical protein